LRVLRSVNYLIIVPVFNAKNAWDAAKIAKAKLKMDAELITCVPIRNDYVCVFESPLPCEHFPVYKASSDRGGR